MGSPFGMSALAPRLGGLRRSEEHTSELQSHVNLVCRLLPEKKQLRWLATVEEQEPLLPHPLPHRPTPPPPLQPHRLPQTPRQRRRLHSRPPLHPPCRLLPAP